MKFIDTHTHLYTEDFDADRAEVVQRAVEAGAEALLLPNIDKASLPQMLRMCEDYPGLCYPMLGLHPTELPERPMELLDEWEKLLENDHPYVAIGEVGVDLYWDASRRDEQVEVFRRQIEWAVKYRLPLVIHSRNAHRELVDTLTPYRDKLCGGVFHCFGGTEEEARELLSFPGFYLGIGGVVTFKKSTLPQVLKNVVPLDRIVVETDAPYLAPTPHRGKRNESALIPLVISQLAQIYGEAIQENDGFKLTNGESKSGNGELSPTPAQISGKNSQPVIAISKCLLSNTYKIFPSLKLQKTTSRQKTF